MALKRRSPIQEACFLLIPRLLLSGEEEPRQESPKTWVKTEWSKWGQELVVSKYTRGHAG